MTESTPSPSLPPFVEAARADVDDDPDAAEARGMAMIAASADPLVDGVHAHLAPYVMARAGAILDAWGLTNPDERPGADARLSEAATHARDRVEHELRDLFATDPEAQGRTPLEIVRTLRAEPTEVLAALGVAEVVRDEFEQRALPDDPYGLAPRTLAELGDDDLGPMLLAWGIGKATVVRARAAKRQSALAGARQPATMTRGDEERRNPMRIVGGGLRRLLGVLHCEHGQAGHDRAGE